MELPGDQAELIRRVAAANPRTVVAVNAASPVTMDWADAVPAVLVTWFGGQEMANALADVLFGENEPSGRLPTTFPVRLEHNPSYGNFPGENGQVRYGEGVFVGYRWYEARGLPVAYPFGHGLSYTTFEIGAPRVSATTFSAGETLTVDVDVTNTGARRGAEVVQCYVAPRDPSVDASGEGAQGVRQSVARPRRDDDRHARARRPRVFVLAAGGRRAAAGAHRPADPVRGTASGTRSGMARRPGQLRPAHRPIVGRRRTGRDHRRRRRGGGLDVAAPRSRNARPRPFTVISVDDHLIEPADLFDGRMPADLVDRAPRVVELDGGNQAWAFEDALYPNIGLNAVIGRPKNEWSMDPVRFDEMRKGCWDIHARIADMDTAGIWASLCFPSLLAGFAGTMFARANDQELGQACVRAWNDWHHEVWAGTYPERIIPLQITWLNDPAVAAHEVRRNAARGFKALSFPENPHHIGLPSMHTDHWDPLLAACEETDTVMCLHTGSASWSAGTPGAPLELSTTLFPVNGIVATADWLWARIPLRFPRLERRALRRRDRLGADAPRPARLRDVTLRRGRRGRVGR